MKKLILVVLFYFSTLFSFTQSVGIPGTICTPETAEVDCLASTTFLYCNNTNEDVFTCGCGLYSYFEGVACVLEHGRLCSEDPSSQQCGVGSYCTGLFETTCGCLSGTGANAERKCRVINYGVECDVAAGKICDNLKFLECSGDSTCGCNSDTTYVGGFVCVGRVGKPCLVDEYPDRCDIGAVCLNNLCECIEGTQENSVDKCRAALGADCDAGRLCDEHNFATCNAHGKCECMDGGNDNGDGRCRATFGNNCTTIPCNEKDDLICDEATKLCKCENGNVDDNGECRSSGGIGNICNDDSQCDVNEFIHCNENIGKCECQSELTELNGQCLAGLGAYCNLAGYPKTCEIGENVVCGKENVCVCAVGFVEDDEGRCIVGVGGECDEEHPCDETEFLICGVGNKCECREGMLDNGVGECRVDLGGACSNEVPCDELRYLECSVISKKCVCMRGFEDNGLGHCRVPLGNDCGGDEHCDEFNYSECSKSSNKCKCILGFHVNGENHCRIDLDGACSENEQCDETNFLQCGTSEVCECISGEPEDGECPSVSIFTCQKSGLHADPEDKEKYHDCVQIKRSSKFQDILLTCPTGTAWKQDILNCTFML